MTRILGICLFLLSLIGTPQSIAGTKAPDLMLTTAQGELRLDDLHGQVVYLEFWASWCAPCRKSFPWMNEVQARYRDKGLRIVAVNLDKDPQEAERFLQQTPASFTVAFDQSGASAAELAVKGMPSSYLIDRDGNIRAEHIGFRSKDVAKLDDEIKDLLEN